MDTQQFIERFAEVFEQPAGTLTAQSELRDSWDSLAQLATIALIDEMYGISVPTSELVECKSVGDVLSLVQKRLT